MSQATIRTAALAVLDSVTDIGITHNRARWASLWNDLRDQYQTTISTVTQLRGWWVEWEGFAPFAEDFESYSGVVRGHRVRIHGLLGLDDSASTELTAAVLTEAVANAFDGAASFHNSVTGNYVATTAAEVEVFEARTIGGALVHYSEITFTVYEAVNN